MKHGLKSFSVAVAATALAACGGSSSSHDASSPGAALKTYLTALANGDGAGACGVLGPAIKKRALEAGSVAGINASDCVSLFSQLKAYFSPAQRSQFRNAKVSSVVIHGNTATATVKGERPAKLSKSGGKWLITGGLAGVGG